MKFKLTTLAFATAMVLSGCNNGGSVNHNNTNDVLDENTMLIENTDDVIFVTKEEAEDIMVVAMEADGEMSLNVPKNGEAAKVEVDDVLYVPPSQEGYMETYVVIEERLVDADGNVTLKVRPATANEAFDNITLEMDSEEMTPTIEGFIMPDGEYVDIAESQDATQVGVLPSVEYDVGGAIYGEYEDAYKLPISYRRIVAKDKFKKGLSEDEKDTKDKACEISLNLANQPDSSEETTSTLTESFKENCDSGLILEGDIFFRPPEVKSNLDLQKINDEDFVFKGESLQYISMNSAYIEADLKGKLVGVDKRLSDTFDLSNTDLYREFEQFRIGDPISTAYVAISGLSADDTKGKLPLFGVVASFTVPNGINVASGTNVRLGAKTVAVVLWAYSVTDLTVEGQVNVTFKIAPTNINMGLVRNEEGKLDKSFSFENREAADYIAKNGIGQVSDDYLHKRDTLVYQAGVNAILNLDYIMGAAIDADFIVGGIRLANVGVSPQVNMSTTLEGNVYQTNDPQAPISGLSGDACLKDTGIGYGVKTYGAFRLNGDFSLGQGWYKVSGGGGIQFKFMSPTEEEAFDETNPAPLWIYTPLKKDICYDSQSPLIDVESITYPTDATTSLVPVKIMAENANLGTIKQWQISYTDNDSKSHTIDLTRNTQGILLQKVEGKYQAPLMPRGVYDITIKATDYDNQSSTIIKSLDIPTFYSTGIQFNRSQEDYTCNDVDFSSTIVSDKPIKTAVLNINNQSIPMQITSTGANTSEVSAENLKFEDCNKQTATLKLTYEDGTTYELEKDLVLYRSDIFVESINVEPTTPEVNTPYKVTIKGANLPMVVDTMTLTGCNSYLLLQKSIAERVYQCTAPATVGENTLLIKEITSGRVLGSLGYDITEQPVIPPSTSKLTATGIKFCATADKTMLDCTLAALGADWFGLQQDGEVQAGESMSYTTLNQNGAECVRDNVTGLIWEQKTDDGGLRDKDNTYSWYNPDSTNNGGDAGTQNGGTCTDSGCDTEAYIQALNNANYCGYSDWRLPTRDELVSIVDYGRYNPAINPIFSNTQSNQYWLASPSANSSSIAWNVSFRSGGDAGNYTGTASNNYKNNYNYVRVVRTSQ